MIIIIIIIIVVVSGSERTNAKKARAVQQTQAKKLTELQSGQAKKLQAEAEKRTKKEQAEKRKRLIQEQKIASAQSVIDFYSPEQKRLQAKLYNPNINPEERAKIKEKLFRIEQKLERAYFTIELNNPGA